MPYLIDLVNKHNVPGFYTVRLNQATDVFDSP